MKNVSNKITVLAKGAFTGFNARNLTLPLVVPAFKKLIKWTIRFRAVLSFLHSILLFARLVLASVEDLSHPEEPPCHRNCCEHSKVVLESEEIRVIKRKIVIE